MTFFLTVALGFAVQMIGGFIAIRYSVRRRNYALGHALIDVCSAVGCLVCSGAFLATPYPWMGLFVLAASAYYAACAWRGWTRREVVEAEAAR